MAVNIRYKFHAHRFPNKNRNSCSTNKESLETKRTTIVGRKQTVLSICRYVVVIKDASSEQELHFGWRVTSGLSCRFGLRFREHIQQAAVTSHHLADKYVNVGNRSGRSKEHYHSAVCKFIPINRPDSRSCYYIFANEEIIPRAGSPHYHNFY